MIISPTGSYELDLPDDVLQDSDERVCSFWRKGGNSALQISGYKREAGEQVSAQQRLAERKMQSGGLWNEMKLVLINAEAAHVAAASTTDEKNCYWLHVYLVWPDLAVYATISKPAGDPPGSEHWALDAIKKIRRRRTKPGL